MSIFICSKHRTVVKRFFADVPAQAKGMGKAVTVISAVPLTDDEKADVKKVTGADEVDYKIEPQILGGLILRAGDKVVDGSVRGDLSSLAGMMGGVSITRMSNLFIKQESRKDIRSDPKSSEGLGGSLPAGSSERLGVPFRMAEQMFF